MQHKLDEIINKAKSITFNLQTINIQEEISEMQKYTNNPPTKSYEQFLAEQETAKQPKPISPGQRYLVASSGVSKTDRDTMTDADIRKHEHLFKTESDALTPLQFRYLKVHFNFTPDDSWTYRKARKLILDHIQENDYDEILAQRLNAWNDAKPKATYIPFTADLGEEF